ncbi:MAG: hypothetical protein R3A48_00245 [Polyangiales bacterium]
MQITADTRIPFPRPLVFATYRDRLSELVPHLPNVRSISVQSRREDGELTHVVNVWRGGGEIPAAARAFLSEAMLNWDDLATWDASAFSCAWRVRTHAFTEAVTCHGTNEFVADGDDTVVRIRGSLSIDAAKIQGVPRLLGGTVSRSVEEVLVKKIAPNLVQVSEGLRLFLEASRGAAPARSG